MCFLNYMIFLQVIEVESVEVEAKSKVVRVDEEAASITADEAQALKNECETELAAAIPALEAALSALDTLKVKIVQQDTDQILKFLYHLILFRQ